MSRRGWLLFGAMCVIWGIPYLLIKVAVGDLAPSVVVFARTGIGALVLVPLATARLLCAIGYAPFAVPDRPGHLPPVRVLVAVVTLGVVCTALGFVLFFHLIAEVGPLRATVITYVNPAVALALGVVLRHEAFTAGAGLGFVLVVGGSVLTSRPPTGAGLRAGPVPVPQIAEP